MAFTGGISRGGGSAGQGFRILPGWPRGGEERRRGVQMVPKGGRTGPCTFPAAARRNVSRGHWRGTKSQGSQEVGRQGFHAENSTHAGGGWAGFGDCPVIQAGFVLRVA